MPGKTASLPLYSGKKQPKRREGSKVPTKAIICNYDTPNGKCDWVFDTEDRRSRHIRIEHRGERAICPLCSKQFRDTHVKQHNCPNAAPVDGNPVTATAPTGSNSTRCNRAATKTTNTNSNTNTNTTSIPEQVSQAPLSAASKVRLRFVLPKPSYSKSNEVRE